MKKLCKTNLDERSGIKVPHRSHDEKILFSFATYKYSFLINYVSNRRWKNELSLFQVFLYRFKKLRDEKLPHNNFKLMANISGLTHLANILILRYFANMLLKNTSTISNILNLFIFHTFSPEVHENLLN